MVVPMFTPFNQFTRSSLLQSVRVRILAVLFAVVIAVLASLGAWTHHVLGQSFERLEAVEAVEKLQLARQIFDERCAALTSIAVAWSNSSSPLKPLTPDKRTPESELPDGAVVCFAAHTSTGPAEVQRTAFIDESVAQHLPELVAFVSPPDAMLGLGVSRSALMTIDRRMLLVGWTGRILAHGKVGVVAAGCWLDDAWNARFGESMQRQTRIQLRSTLRPTLSLTDTQLRVLDGKQAMVMEVAEEDEMFGHLSMNLNGGPLVISVSLDRAIVGAGNLTWQILITSIAVIVGIFAVALIIIMEWGILARLTRVSRDLAEIAQTNDPVSLVYHTGADEIGCLGMEINRLLGSQRGWREQISRRNASMSLIFDTLPIGLLSVDALGRIQPDRSSATAELLGRPDLEGLDLGDLLAPGPANLTLRRRLSDYLAIVRGGMIDAAGLDDVNPLKMVTVQRASGPVVLRLHFYSLENIADARRPQSHWGGVVEVSGVLVTITDISDERRLAAEAEKSQLDYQQLKAMAEDVDLFHNFLVKIRSLVKQLNELSGRMGAAPDRVQLSDLQRNVRALRSGGGVFGLAALELAARNFDAELVRYLGMNHLSDVEVRRCRFGVADLEAAVIAVERQFRALLGSQDESVEKNRMNSFGQRGGQPRIQGDLRVPKRSTLVQLAGLLVQPVRLGLAPSIRLVVPMARRRGLDVRFSVHGEEVMVDQAQLTVLNRVLPHLLRFTCDQGFDAPTVRAQAGKPPAPLLTIVVERNEHHVVVTIADDGGGIDPQRMRDMAVEQKVLTRDVADGLDDHAAQGLVFTLDYESEDETLSGVRPVGMNLIYKNLAEVLNADVAIQSTVGQGTAVTISLPLSQP